ncbi:MAG: hypothetical protein ABIP75_07230 [Pyrinomonadaceae bacterium]
MDQYVERVVDLTAPDANDIYNLSVEAAREVLLNQSAAALARENGIRD